MAKPDRAIEDPRRSLWRGPRDRVEPAEEIQENIQAVAVTHEPAQAEPEAEVPAAHSMPERLSFDLEREEDLESFRDRLFASSPREEKGGAAQRSPIAVARPKRQSISPAAREQYRVTREPAGPHPSRRRPDEETVEIPRVEELARPDRAVLAEQPRITRSAAPRPQRRPIEPVELLDAPEDAWYEPDPIPRFDVRSLVEPETELLDMTITIAPGVEQKCVTCRNYRPSEQSGRGWCTNSWAFTHRQMVNETDLACKSAIGCWWLPADEEVWLDEFEVASDATPRVDRLIAHLDPERRAVGN
jgi:hypothetical protein